MGTLIIEAEGRRGMSGSRRLIVLVLFSTAFSVSNPSLAGAAPFNVAIAYPYVSTPYYTDIDNDDVINFEYTNPVFFKASGTVTQTLLPNDRIELTLSSFSIEAYDDIEVPVGIGIWSDTMASGEVVYLADPTAVTLKVEGEYVSTDTSPGWILMSVEAGTFFYEVGGSESSTIISGTTSDDPVAFDQDILPSRFEVGDVNVGYMSLSFRLQDGDKVSLMDSIVFQAQVPEPTSMLLLGLGLIGLAGVRKRPRN